MTTIASLLIRKSAGLKSQKAPFIVEPLSRSDVIIAAVVCLVYIAAVIAAYIWTPS